MEPKLIQSQTQRLILSPLLRQYLRLLQLPIAELRNTIEQELAENPVLEEVQKDPTEEPLASRSSEGQTEDAQGLKELRFEETLHTLDKLDESFEDGFYSQQDLSLPEPRQSRAGREYQESLITKKESLFDYLLWQIGFLELSEKERPLAEEIVGNLTEEGYLEVSLEQIAATCQAQILEVEKVLTLLQTLDPPGIAARNLQETLRLQLERKGPEARLAQRIVNEFFSFLEKKDWGQIAKATGESGEAIRAAARLIVRLDPKPGRTFYGEDPIAVTPDASVYYEDSEDGKLVVEVHDEYLPELRISSYYRRLLKDPKLDQTSRRFLKEKIQAAVDFVKALSQRRSTLGGITQEIVDAQAEFFGKGFSHLKPLRLKDIAERLRIHESTVSRAIQGKYLSTPQGTLPYKSFFSSKLDRVEGGVESQKSTMEKIRGVIASEDPKKPLSDQAICDQLQKEGLKIARRTVAKYRELLKILPTHLRRKK